MTQCMAITTLGVQCKREAVKDGYCALPAHNANMLPPEERKIKQETSPWNDSDNSWRPDNARLKKQHEGFSAKFADINKVDKHKQVGWVVANCKDYGEEPKGTDTSLQRGDLILMEIPIERKKQRDAYINNLTEKRSQTAKDVLQQGTGLGAGALRETGFSEG